MTKHGLIIYMAHLKNIFESISISSLQMVSILHDCVISVVDVYRFKFCFAYKNAHQFNCTCLLINEFMGCLRLLLLGLMLSFMFSFFMFISNLKFFISDLVERYHQGRCIYHGMKLDVYAPWETYLIMLHQGRRHFVPKK